MHIVPSALPPVSQKAKMQVGMQAPSMPASKPAPMPAPMPAPKPAPMPAPKPAPMPSPVPSPIPSLIPSSMQPPSQAWMTDSTQMQAMPHKYMGECDSSRDCPMFQHCNAVGNCTSNESCRY